MCGIVGIISKNKIDVNLDGLLNKIHHRGPDKTGKFYWDANTLKRTIDDSFECNICFGHKRLSIIDLTDAASQPFHSSDGNFTLLYNGEVYNYLEIKEELKSLGVIFRTNSDTEVIIESIINWGIEIAISKFEGMFAFAYLDNNSGDVILVRDAFGIKPLYYSFFENTFIFSSEIKVILQYLNKSVELDNQSVISYLLHGISDYDNQTFFKSIKQFEKGSWAKFNYKEFEKGLNFKKYWSPENILQNNDISFEDAVLKTRNLFLKNIKLHLRSDVNFGVALSGGLDSSAIACSIRYLYPELPIHTFSYVPDEEKLSEKQYIDIINKKIGGISHQIDLKEIDLFKELDDLIELQDLPFGSLSILSQYKIYEAAKNLGIKVLLNGQGADEILAGYSPLQGFRLASLLSQYKVKSAIKFLKNQKYWEDRTVRSVLFTGLYQIFSNSKFNKIVNIFKNPKLPNWIINVYENKYLIKNDYYLCTGPNYLNSALQKSIKNGLSTLLRYDDRNSMGNSIESRVPFLTREFAEFVLSLPEHFLINEKGGSKIVFREAMRGIVPDLILDRKEKIGFESPDFKILSKNKDYLINEINQSIGYEHLENVSVLDFIKLSLNIKNNYSSLTWRLINFIIWNNKRE